MMKFIQRREQTIMSKSINKVLDTALVALALLSSGFWGTAHLLKVGASKSGTAMAVTSFSCGSFGGTCVHIQVLCGDVLSTCDAGMYAGECCLN
jgi:hypothetical protein